MFWFYSLIILITHRTFIYMIQIEFKFLGFEYKMFTRAIWMRCDSDYEIWCEDIKKSFVTIISIYFYTVIITVESYNHNWNTIHDIEVWNLIFRRVMDNRHNGRKVIWFRNFDTRPEYTHRLQCFSCVANKCKCWDKEDSRGCAGEYNIY